MKLLLTALFPLMFFSAIGQETKKVIEKHSDPKYKEEYYVLETDRNIRFGNYKKLGYKDCIIINGYYKNNKKDSIWTEYYTWDPNKIERQGYYSDDKKNGWWIEYYPYNKSNIPNCKGEYLEDSRIGIWEFRDRVGDLIQKYDFTTKELIFFKPDKNLDNDYEILTDSGIEKRKLDRSLLYIGGEDLEKFIITSNTQYPPNAMENLVSGTVWVSFIVDINGIAKDHKVQKGIGSGCDEEALRVVKDFLIDWIPGKLNGHLVTVKYAVPVNFKIMY